MKTRNSFWVLYTFIFLFISGVSFTSCSDDDDYSSKDLVGTWQLTYDEGWEKEDGKIIDDWSEEIKNGSTTSFQDGGVLIDGDGEKGTWSLKGNKLTIEFEDSEPYTGKILELNSTTLVVEGTFSETYQGVKYEYWNKSQYKKVK